MRLVAAAADAPTIISRSRNHLIWASSKVALIVVRDCSCSIQFESEPNDECKIRSDLIFPRLFEYVEELPLPPPNSTRAIASASNVARVTKLGKGRSLARLALAAPSVSRTGNHVILRARNGRREAAAPYEESSGEGR